MGNNYIALSRYVARGWCKGVENALRADNSLDVTVYDGKFFNIAVGEKHYDVVKALLDHFEERQLGKFPRGSLEFLWLKKKMCDLIQVAIEDVELSKDMEELLKPYLLQEEVVDFDIEDLSEHNEEYPYHTPPHTSDEEHESNHGYMELNAENIAMLESLQEIDTFSTVIGEDDLDSSMGVLLQ